MRKSVLALLLAAFFAATSFAAIDPAKANILGVDKVKEGMLCYGYSTLGPKGQTRFSCRVLGVLHDELGPGHNWIAAIIEGANFKETGIIAGQSGSPVYVSVGGKRYFIGTVSYGDTSSKSPVAYLTPAEELLAVGSYDGKSVATPAAPTSFGIADEFKGFLKSNGFESLYDGMRRGTVTLGLTAEPNVSSTHFVKDPKPGDVMGVQLAFGDFSLGGFGTVSYVDSEKRKIFLFGHPMLLLGPSEYRLVRAKVLGVQASYERSYVIAAPVDGAPTAGVIDQDRETGIMGTLGKEPKDFIPYKVRLTTSSGRVVEKKFYATNDRLLGPMVGAIGVASIVRSWSRVVGPKTVFVKGQMVTDSGTIDVNDVFYGNSGGVSEIAASVDGRLKTLLDNDYKKVTIKNVSLEASIFDEIRLLKVERVVLEESVPILAPGSTATVKVTLAQPEKDPKVLELKLSVPKDANFGTAKVVVGSADTVDSLESVSTQVVNLNTLLENLNQKRNPNRVYAYVVYPPAKPAKTDGSGEEVAKGVRKISKRLASSVEEFEISPSAAGILSNEKDGDFIIQGQGSTEFKIGDPKTADKSGYHTGPVPATDD